MVFPKVTIVILNWNGYKDTLECLDSLLKSDYPNYDIVIVDNGSKNDSIEIICNHLSQYNKKTEILTYSDDEYPYLMWEKYTKKVKIGNNEEIIIINNDINYGFAKGNNIGIIYSINALDAKYILLLNNDTIVLKNFLTELIKEAEKSDCIGICSAKILNEYNKRIIDSTGHIIKMGHIQDRGSGEKDLCQYDKKTNVIGAKAASCLYRVKMINEIGLFDESFFTTYEDAEFSWRAHSKGWIAKFVPNSIVYHKKGKSIKSKEAISYELPRLSLINMVITVKRHGSTAQKSLFILAFTEMAILSLIAHLLGRNDLGIMPYIHAFKEFFKDHSYKRK